jgi:thymidylate synthase
MRAEVTGLGVGDFVHTFGDAHIYHNHFEQTQTQLARSPKPLPTLEIVTKRNSIFDFEFEDFEIVGYDPDPHIKAQVAV